MVIIHREQITGTGFCLLMKQAQDHLWSPDMTGRVDYSLQCAVRDAHLRKVSQEENLTPGMRAESKRVTTCFLCQQSVGATQSPK